MRAVTATVLAAAPRHVLAKEAGRQPGRVHHPGRSQRAASGAAPRVSLILQTARDELNHSEIKNKSYFRLKRPRLYPQHLLAQPQPRLGWSEPPRLLFFSLFSSFWCLGSSVLCLQVLGHPEMLQKPSLRSRT